MAKRHTLKPELEKAGAIVLATTTLDRPVTGRRTYPSPWRYTAAGGRSVPESLLRDLTTRGFLKATTIGQDHAEYIVTDAGSAALRRYELANPAALASIDRGR